MLSQITFSKSNHCLKKHNSLLKCWLYEVASSNRIFRRLVNLLYRHYLLLFLHGTRSVMSSLRFGVPRLLNYLLPVRVCIGRGPSRQTHLHLLHLGTIPGCIGTWKLWVKRNGSVEASDVRDPGHSFRCASQRCSEVPLSFSMFPAPILSCPFVSSSIWQKFQALPAWD